MRAINKVLGKMKDTSPSADHSTANQGNTALILIDLKGKLAGMDAKLASIQKNVLLKVKTYHYCRMKSTK